MKKIVSIMLILTMVLCIGPISFAKCPEYGQIASIGATSTLRDKRYLELTNETHEHTFDTNQCICGVYKADYSGYESAKARYDVLIKNSNLNDAAKDYARAEMLEIINEYLGSTGIRNNYSEEEQYILDGVANGLNDLCDDLEAGIADGTFIKPDYTEIEAKIAELEEKDVDNKFKGEIGAIKTELQEIKSINPESMAEIADELAALNIEIDSVSEKIDKYNNCDHKCHKNGIAGCFWKITLFFSKIFGTNQTCECGIAHY